MKKIILPYGVTLRDYQKNAWDKFFVDKIRHHLLIWHRRAGKSKFAINIISAASQLRVGAYYYLFPKLTQARRVIWEGRGHDGYRFIDHFPADMIKKINNTEMKIEFKNGSIFRLVGTDNLNYDSLMGGNPLGILYDEFAMQNPVARDYMLPIIAENGGWEMIISTPRGTNHLFDLYQGVIDHSEWHVNRLTVDQTLRNDGSRVVELSSIDDLKKGGWSDDKVDQEFYCSFEAAVRGAYFSRQIKQAENEGRICTFSIDSRVPICTYWDLGINDATSIWVVQRVQDEIRCIAYYENNNEPIAHYINWVRDFRDRHQLVCDMHFGPHDVDTRSLASGKSIRDIAWELGFKFERVPRIKSKPDAIEMARSIFNRCWFHKEMCKQGISCLREYHKSYNENMKTYSDRPVHNWASHGADSFMTMAQTVHIKSNPSFNIQTTNLMSDLN